MAARVILCWAGLMYAVLRRQKLDERVIWSMAVLGNGVTALAWFGANTLAQGAKVPWLCLASIASQVALTMVRRERVQS